MTETDEPLLFGDPADDLAAYALGALTPEQRARVESLIERSAAARDELLEYLATAEAIGMAVPGLDPPPAVRAALIEQAGRDLRLMRLARKEARSARPRIPAGVMFWLRPWRMAYAGTTAMLLAVVAIVIVFGLENSRLNSEISEMRDEIRLELENVRALSEAVRENNEQVDLQGVEVARLTQVNAGLNEALRNQQWLTYVTNTRQFSVPNYFVGGPQAPEANGTLAVKNFDTQAVLLITGLKPAPEGYRYALWLTGESKSEAVAWFTVNAAGMARVEFELPDRIALYESAMITLERIDGASSREPGEEIMAAGESP